MDENSLSNCSLNHSPISCPLMASASLALSYHLEACPLGLELPSVFLRIEFALVEQRLAADERGGLPLVEADFEAELFHIHQFLEQREPFLGFLDDGFQE